jgi:hypothetical protein
MGRMRLCLLERTHRRKSQGIEFESDESSQFDCRGSKCELRITTRQQMIPTSTEQSVLVGGFVLLELVELSTINTEILCFGGDATEK